MEEVKRYYCWSRAKGSKFPFVCTVVKTSSIKKAKEVMKDYEIDGKIKRSHLPYNAL